MTFLEWWAKNTDAACGLAVIVMLLVAMLLFWSYMMVRVFRD